MKHHEDILKRARLLAQAANDAAEAALAQKNNNTSLNNQVIEPIPSIPVTKKEKTFPPLNNGSSRSSNSKKSVKHPDNSPQATHSILESNNSNLSLPAISHKAESTSIADSRLESSTDGNSNDVSSFASASLPEVEQVEILNKYPQPENSYGYENRSSSEKIESNDLNQEKKCISSLDHDSSIVDTHDSAGLEDEAANDPISQHIFQYHKSRSNVVNRRNGPNQVLCYLCCNEFGTSSLLIHQKTCWSKHEWALERILNDETISIKEAKKNWKQCEVPSNGSSLPSLPSSGSDTSCFEQYNQEALKLFFTHVLRCLWCRMNNSIAKMITENVRKAEEDNRRRKELEEAERRRKAEEDEARRRREMEEEEERRRREEEERRRREEEERRRMQLEDEASEAERRRLLALGKHSFLRKGKGIQAANQTAKLMEEKEKNEIAKREILNYSLNQAKKKGYLSENKKETSSTVKYVEMTEEEMKNFMEQQNQNHSSWDSKWTVEEEELFANSEVVLRTKCI